jgi:hypothetical protein
MRNVHYFPSEAAADPRSKERPSACRALHQKTIARTSNDEIHSCRPGDFGRRRSKWRCPGARIFGFFFGSFSMSVRLTVACRTSTSESVSPWVLSMATAVCPLLEWRPGFWNTRRSWCRRPWNESEAITGTSIWFYYMNSAADTRSPTRSSLDKRRQVSILTGK